MNNTQDDDDDDLLKRVRRAEDRLKRVQVENQQADNDHSKFANTGRFGKVASVLHNGKKYSGPVGSMLLWCITKIARGLKWAAFERANGEFKRKEDGRLHFSPARLAKTCVAGVGIMLLGHVALSAIYFYATQFEELVYTTGKQEIITGELYQFTGCTSLPCSTDADNGKFYKIESSWYLPYLLYPEETVYANIPQQDGACFARGYGLYSKSFKAIHRKAQWYQKVYNVSCRPYTEIEKQQAIDSGIVNKPPEIMP